MPVFIDKSRVTKPIEDKHVAICLPLPLRTDIFRGYTMHIAHVIPVGDSVLELKDAKDT